MVSWCPACKQVEYQPLRVPGVLMSPPVWVHKCPRTRRWLYTVNGVFYTVGGFSLTSTDLPPNVKWRTRAKKRKLRSVRQ